MPYTAEVLKSRWFAHFLVVLMLAVMGGLLVKNARDDSATTDEPIHILSGYEYWHGIFTVNPEHPPLGKQLAALPLIFIRPNLPANSEFTNALSDFYYDSWAETKAYARHWLYGTPGNNPDQIVFAARMVVVIFTLILGGLLFVVSRGWYGTAAGLIAVFLFAFSPTLLAHGHLANTDLWATLGFFLGVFGFAWYLERPTLARMIIAATAFATALLLKSSSIALIPICAILWWIKYYSSKQHPLYGVKRFLLTAIVFFFVALSAIWADYGFPMHAAPPLTAHAMARDRDNSLAVLAPLLQHSPVALYFKALIMTTTAIFSDRSAYCLGHFYTGGVWYYFPLAFLVKEPLALLILLIAGTVFWPGWKRPVEFHDWVLIVPVFFYAGVSLFPQMNIGIRHLLPIYPFLFIFIGYSLSKFLTRYKAPSRKVFLASWGVLSLLLGWYLYANISIYPYYLTYFNQLAGGPVKGVRVLADSNIDWGQDMKRLSRWLRKQDIRGPVKMQYFWSDAVQANYYGISFVPLEKNHPTESGWVVIGATDLQRPEFNWLKQYSPTKIIGNSVYVYKL
jgi:hypothetical protein